MMAYSQDIQSVLLEQVEYLIIKTFTVQEEVDHTSWSVALKNHSV